MQKLNVNQEMEYYHEFYVLYLIRNNLIELFSERKDIDYYLIANELLLKLETIIRGQDDS